MCSVCIYTCDMRIFIKSDIRQIGASITYTQSYFGHSYAYIYVFIHLTCDKLEASIVYTPSYV